jgi:hypothetical protein
MGLTQRLNMLFRNDITRNTPVIIGMDGNSVILITKDLKEAFPDLLFVSKLAKDDNTFDNYVLSLFTRGRPPAQGVLDNVFYFIKGWLMAKKKKFDIVSIPPNEEV